MEQFSKFNFILLPYSQGLGWFYRIYNKDVLIAESSESFDSEGTARYAAIGHISILENFFSSQPSHS